MSRSKGVAYRLLMHGQAYLTFGSYTRSCTRGRLGRASGFCPTVRRPESQLPLARFGMAFSCWSISPRKETLHILHFGPKRASSNQPGHTSECRSCNKHSIGSTADGDHWGRVFYLCGARTTATLGAERCTSDSQE